MIRLAPASGELVPSTLVKNGNSQMEETRVVSLRTVPFRAHGGRKPKYSGKKYVLVPQCSPKIPHGTAWASTVSSMAGSQRLQAGAIMSCENTKPKTSLQKYTEATK